MATPPDFSPGQVLTAAHMDAVGLWLVKTQTIGSGVSSVTVTGAFSADYDNYRIVVSGARNTSTDISWSLSFPGYVNQYYGSFQYVNYSTNTLTAASNNNASSFVWVMSAATTGVLGGGMCDLFAPFDSGSMTRIIAGPITYQQITGTYTGVHGVAASHTSFILTPGGGTLTGGTIRVYGYRN